MNIRVTAVGLLLVPVALVAQAVPTASIPAREAARWAVRLRSADRVEHGDLRLTAAGGRLLLERSDTAFLALATVVRQNGQLTFTVPRVGARVEATLEPGGNVMQGSWTAADGTRHSWQAERIQEGIVRWPVRPRVRVRQLVLGSSASVTLVPSQWAAALASSATLETEHAALVRAAALPVVSAAERPGRSLAMVLGADPSTRGAVQRVLERIAASSAADTAFTRLFVGRNGLILDVHDRAEAHARQLDRLFDPDAAARGLVLLGALPDEAREIEGRAAAAALALWPAWQRGDVAMDRQLAALRLRDRAAVRALEYLWQGYTQAVPWWGEAVRWLLGAQWMPTASGARSPAQLVAAFWGRDALALPDLLVERMGGFAATPLVSADRLTARLILPLNATATEWLAAGRGEALTTWQALRWTDTLTLGPAAASQAMLSPRDAVARPAIGGLLAPRDGVRIDPAIMPLLAVATVIHEWHHVLASAARLEGRGAAVEVGHDVLRLREDDPWLAEGFAEWATEESLRPVRTSLPLLTLVDFEKRMTLHDGMSEDPHAMGYRLVRAAAARLPRATRRDALVARLHDAGAVARLARFADSPQGTPLLLRRPVTAAIVPEITFTWDAGVADQPLRRLLLPPFPPER